MRLHELLNEVGEDSRADAREVSLSGQETNALAVYNALNSAGFSPSQSRALVGEIGRENSLRDNLMFGSHSDPANQATNIGIISWQGDRKDALLDFMGERGLIDDNGALFRGQDSLNAQAEFLRNEMISGSHGGSRGQISRVQDWVNNPNPSDNLSRDVVGGDFIRWRLNDPQYRDSGLRNRNNFIGMLDTALEKTGGSIPSFPSNNQYASAGSTNYATDATPAISTPDISTTQPSKTIDPRFDMSSLSNVGTTDFNLKRGVSGDNVTQLQTQLQNLGYDVGSTGADGKFGRNTAAAVRQFQTDYGLQVDSIAGDQTMSALRQASSLKLDPAKSDFSVSSPNPTGGGGAISPEIPDFHPPLT